MFTSRAQKKKKITKPKVHRESEVKVSQSCPVEYIQSMKFSKPEYWSGQPFPSPGDHPNRGIKLRSPTLQVDSLPAEPQGKPKNTGVGNLSLLQRIFPTQGSNWGLLHCRQFLYQLSYQGSPFHGRERITKIDIEISEIETKREYKKLVKQFFEKDKQNRLMKKKIEKLK